MQTILLIEVLTAAQAGVVVAEPRLEGSLGRTSEVILFTYDVGTRAVPVCNKADKGSLLVGCREHIELEIPYLNLINHAFSGGGETQVHAGTSTHRYIVYERTVRTSFGIDGHHAAQSQADLVVRGRGQTTSNRQCTKPATLSPIVWISIPLGDYAPH